MIDRDDYGEPLPAQECAACRRGRHHDCWGPTPSRWRTTYCGCECNRDDDEPLPPLFQRDPGDETEAA